MANIPSAEVIQLERPRFSSSASSSSTSSSVNSSSGSGQSPTVVSLEASSTNNSSAQLLGRQSSVKPVMVNKSYSDVSIYNSGTPRTTEKPSLGNNSLDGRDHDKRATMVDYPPFATRDKVQSDIKLTQAQYATSVDERGYISVYEFTYGDQIIMWDYHSGYVHLTGIWKALGNSKVSRFGEP
jgi:hypothetical protein